MLSCPRGYPFCGVRCQEWPWDHAANRPSTGNRATRQAGRPQDVILAGCTVAPWPRVQPGSDLRTVVPAMTGCRAGSVGKARITRGRMSAYAEVAPCRGQEGLGTSECGEAPPSGGAGRGGSTTSASGEVQASACTGRGVHRVTYSNNDHFTNAPVRVSD